MPALAHAPIIRMSTAAIDAVCATASVATKITAAATTVSSVSTLSGRLVEVAVVRPAHRTMIPVTTIACFGGGTQVRRRELAQKAPAASNAIASARNAISFGRLKTSRPLL